jgi:hypothetical protein
MISEREISKLGAGPGDAVVIVFRDGSVKIRVEPGQGEPAGEIVSYRAPPMRNFLDTSLLERSACVRHHEVQPSYSILSVEYPGATIFRCKNTVVKGLNDLVARQEAERVAKKMRRNGVTLSVCDESLEGICQVPYGGTPGNLLIFLDDRQRQTNACDKCADYRIKSGDWILSKEE